MVSSDIRKQARASLKGKWRKGALMTLVYILIIYAMQFVANFIPLIGSIALLVIEIPIAYGIIVSFMKLKRGEDVSLLGFLTDGFAAFEKSWSVAWNIVKKLIIPIILLFVFLGIMIAGTVMTTADLITNSKNAVDSYQSLLNYEMDELDNSESSFGTSYRSGIRSISATPEDLIGPEQKTTGLGSGVLLMVGSIGYFVALIYMAVKSLYYSLEMYILKDNEELSGKEIVEKSAELMKGNRWNYVWLSLTFIGWMFLAGLTLGIGMFWLVPYIQISQIIFYEDRAGIFNEVEEVIKEN